MTASDLAGYHAAGFGGQALRGTSPAVVVIDLTNGFTNPDSPLGADGADVITHTNTILRCAREKRLQVVVTKIAFSHPAQARAWRAKAPGVDLLRAGHPSTEFDPRLELADSDLELVKFGASAFFDTPLRTLLQSWGVDTLITCGATTSGCVRATAVDGMQAGYGVLVPRQAVLDRASGPHDAALFDLQQKYADVVEVDDVIAYLDQLRAA